MSIALHYAPSLNDFFVSDDFLPLRVLSQNAATTGDGPGWWHALAGERAFLYRPVHALSARLLFDLSGLNPLGWHLFNVLAHLSVCALVAALVRRFVKSDWAALGAGWLFGLHFINAEAVIWISARSTILASLLVILAVWLETAHRRHRWSWQRYAGLVAAALALLTKEHAVALPLLLLLVPREPCELFDVPPTPSARSWAHAVREALRHGGRTHWPYWLLTTIFVLSRWDAVANSTHQVVYRIELGLNVIKNLTFVSVASLFPLDFRSGLEMWNQAYVAGAWNVLAGRLLDQPGFLLGPLIAGGFWLSVLIWGNPAARRLTLWILAAALPTLFFRGTGERLLYLGVAGAAGVLAVLLAGWHRSFVVACGRAGRLLAPTAMCVILLTHAVWLQEKTRDWRTASDVSAMVVAGLKELAPRIPKGSVIRFRGLPDNINGAWVFRWGIEDAFVLFANRPDVKAIRSVAGLPDAAIARIPIYEWNGERFERIRFPVQ